MRFPRLALLVTLLALPSLSHAREGAERVKVRAEDRAEQSRETRRERGAEGERGSRLGEAMARGRARVARKSALAESREFALTLDDRPGKVVGPDADPIKSLPRAKGERFVIGVMGGAGADSPADVNATVERLGEAIADAGHVTLTGAAPGLPDRAVRGARRKGGLTVGIAAFERLADHVASGGPTNFDVIQTTRQPAVVRGEVHFIPRDFDNIIRSDMVIIAGGRFGTANELTIALEERRPIGILTGTGGIADGAVKEIIAASTRAGKPPGAPVIFDSDPERLVKRLIAAKREFDKSGVKGPFTDGSK